MANYREQLTEYTEKLAIDIFKKLGITAISNNRSNITNVDLLVGANNTKVDVQFSQDFAKWGDLRLDFVSAYSKGIKGQSYSTDNLFKKFESENGLKVDKVGKFFQKDYLDAVIVLFYDQKLVQNNNAPDNILIISKKYLLDYFDENIQNIIKDVKLNHKEILGDLHGSAFIPIKISDLIQKAPCYYGSLTDLLKKASEIKKYLNA